MVTHQLQVRCRPVKVRRSDTDVLPLRHNICFLLTARNFAEVNELRVGLESVARREVTVLVALVQPWVEVSRHAVRRHGARLHAVFERAELPKQLRAAGDVKAFVDTDDLH